MAPLQTLLLGGLVWAWELGETRNRVPRGLAGMHVWLVLFSFVALLTAQIAAERRRATGAGHPGVPPVAPRRMARIILLDGSAAAALLVYDVARLGGRFGILHPQAALGFAPGLLILGLLLLPLGPWARRRLPARRPLERPARSPGAAPAAVA